MIKDTNKYFSNKGCEKLLVTLGYLWPLPVMYYFYLYGHYSTNTPYGDDISIIIERTVNFLQASSLPEGLTYLFAQSEEYRVVIPALSGVISTQLLGYINFSLIGLVGSLGFFVGIFVVVCAAPIERTFFRILLLISFLLLASPVYLACMFWANCAAGHFLIIFFSSLACFFLARPGFINLGLFEFFMVITIFTNGAGIALLPVGFLGIFLCQNKSTLKQSLFVHGAITLTVVILSVWSFDRDVLEMIIRIYSQEINSPVISVLSSIKWGFAWVGSWAALSENFIFSIIVGVLQTAFLGTLLYCLFKNKQCKPYAQLVLFITFLFIVSWGASSLRGGILDLRTKFLFGDRFRVYSLPLAISTLVLFLCMIKDRRIFSIKVRRCANLSISMALLFSVGYFLLVNNRWKSNFVKHKNKQIECAIEWNMVAESMPCLWHGENKKIMDRAVKMNILYIDKYGGEPIN